MDILPFTFPTSVGLPGDPHLCKTNILYGLCTIFDWRQLTVNNSGTFCDSLNSNKCLALNFKIILIPLLYKNLLHSMGFIFSSNLSDGTRFSVSNPN